MPQATTAPAISVLMPASDTPAHALASVQSLLAQGFEDFELLVPAGTPTLAAVDDLRLRHIPPAADGAAPSAAAPWLALRAAARAPLLAWIAAGDFSRPHRLARQSAYLAAHPDIALLATGAARFDLGRVTPATADPSLAGWRLHLGAAPPLSTWMARTEAVRQAGADDPLAFAHRMLARGAFAVLPDDLALHRPRPPAADARALIPAYAALLGESDAPGAAALVARHLVAHVPFGPGDAQRLAAVLARLAQAYADAHALSPAPLAAAAAEAWGRMIAAMLRAGHPGALRHLGRTALPAALRALRTPTRPAPMATHAPVTINTLAYHPVPPSPDDPPVLNVVVDTEAEFDWNQAFDRSLTAVSGMRQQEPVQHLFESWGVRPIYVVDYAVASQPEGFGPLRGFLDRRACVVGAHMHAWITPPFEETISEYNSFGGNLPRELEARKLRALVAMIRRNFAIDPLIFRAGRYGVGPNTIDLLAELGFQLDLSLLPGADLRPRGGPDFRFADCVPYRAGASAMLSVPMTRGQIGALAPLPAAMNGLLQSRLGQRLRLRGVLARLHLANTVTLTPEGVTAEEQLRLIDAMLARGCRSFMLHYHSPSLGKQTPYVRSDAELATFLNRIEAVCRHFFQRRGGLPGHPADLLPQAMRTRLWPGPA